jgi:hypothetical protein
LGRTRQVAHAAHAAAARTAGNNNTAQNLFYTSEGKVVYYTAGVGVVYQRPPIHHMVGPRPPPGAPARACTRPPSCRSLPSSHPFPSLPIPFHPIPPHPTPPHPFPPAPLCSHAQYFFLGHNDDISALALCQAPIDVKGKSYPGGTLVATGQVGLTRVERGGGKQASSPIRPLSSALPSAFPSNLALPSAFPSSLALPSALPAHAPHTTLNPPALVAAAFLWSRSAPGAPCCAS